FTDCPILCLHAPSPRVSRHSLHDALPIFAAMHTSAGASLSHAALRHLETRRPTAAERQICSQSHDPPVRQAAAALAHYDRLLPRDRKSTRLNSSHVKISYAVFCLKKKKCI